MRILKYGYTPGLGNENEARPYIEIINELCGYRTNFLGAKNIRKIFGYYFVSCYFCQTVFF